MSSKSKTEEDLFFALLELVHTIKRNEINGHFLYIDNKIKYKNSPCWKVAQKTFAEYAYKYYPDVLFDEHLRIINKSPVAKLKLSDSL